MITAKQRQPLYNNEKDKQPIAHHRLTGRNRRRSLNLFAIFILFVFSCMYRSLIYQCTTSLGKVCCSHAYNRPTIPPYSHVIIVDAGSTGSRVHVYKFNLCGESPRLLEEKFVHTQPGLSSYATASDSGKDYAFKAAESLDSLLDVAMEYIPSHMHSCTPILVAATAGLRLLPGHQAQDIIDAVGMHIQSKYPFMYLRHKETVSIMDGKDEAIYAWMTVNYLLDKFGMKDKSITAAIMDMGGGSTQIVFEPNYHNPSLTELQPTCKIPPKSLDGTCGEFFVKKKLDIHDYTLYQHSFLGYGLNEARKKIHLDNAISVLSVNPNSGNDLVVITERQEKEKIILEYFNFHKNVKSIDVETVKIVVHPCFPKSHFHHSENDNVLIVGSRNDGLDESAFESCANIVSHLFDKQTCTYEPRQCSFNGIFQPDLKETFVKHEDSEMYIFSYFYDRTRLLLDMENDEFSRWAVGDLKSLAQISCSLHDHEEIDEDLHKKFDQLMNDNDKLKKRFDSPQQLSEYIHSIIHRPQKKDDHLCMDLTFMYKLLSTGYGLSDKQQLKIEKKINGAETGWCLGAALDVLQHQLLDSSEFCW